MRCGRSRRQPADQLATRRLKGFTPQPLRSRVEHSPGVLTDGNKRPVRDFEQSTEQSETVIKVGNARYAMRMCIRLA
jgi:hypothetical protein